MNKKLVDIMKQNASDCVSHRERNNGDPLFMVTHEGVGYCKWLTLEDVDSHKKKGVVICPHADLSVVIDEKNSVYKLEASGVSQTLPDWTVLRPRCNYKEK